MFSEVDCLCIIRLLQSLNHDWMSLTHLFLFASKLQFLIWQLLFALVKCYSHGASKIRSLSSSPGLKSTHRTISSTGVFHFLEVYNSDVFGLWCGNILAAMCPWQWKRTQQHRTASSPALIWLESEETETHSWPLSAPFTFFFPMNNNILPPQFHKNPPWGSAAFLSVCSTKKLTEKTHIHFSTCQGLDHSPMPLQTLSIRLSLAKASSNIEQLCSLAGGCCEKSPGIGFCGSVHYHHSQPVFKLRSSPVVPAWT